MGGRLQGALGVGGRAGETLAKLRRETGGERACMSGAGDDGEAGVGGELQRWRAGVVGGAGEGIGFRHHQIDRQLEEAEVVVFAAGLAGQFEETGRCKRSGWPAEKPQVVATPPANFVWARRDSRRTKAWRRRRRTAREWWRGFEFRGCGDRNVDGLRPRLAGCGRSGVRKSGAMQCILATTSPGWGRRRDGTRCREAGSVQPAVRRRLPRHCRTVVAGPRRYSARSASGDS